MWSLHGLIIQPTWQPILHNCGFADEFQSMKRADADVINPMSLQERRKQNFLVTRPALC